jgi:F420-non-reducing hydrogenase iron-sulfur subunit
MRMGNPVLNGQNTRIKTTEARQSIVVFTCNWLAFSGLEEAGRNRFSYSPSIYPIKVKCLGQISPGIILKALEKGADGVILLGCPPGECHYEFGNRRAEEIFAEAKELALLLGYKDEQFKLDWIPEGNGEFFINQVETFIKGLNGIHP